MKVQEILMEAYTAYVLDDASREMLAKRFPPKYPEFIGHHITVDFGVPTNTPPPQDAYLKVVGYADSGDGIEALVVSVNNNRVRADGKMYHLTWSLDRSKYKPKDSNSIVSAAARYTMVKSIPITVTPETLQ